jgi:hypothetical protein
MSSLPIEIAGGDRRTIIFDGRSYDAENINLRMLGCPSWLADKVEAREAAQKGVTTRATVTPARIIPSTEELRQRAERLGRQIAEER